FLYIFPTSLDGMLRALGDRATRLKSLRRVFTSAEVLDDDLRDRVKRQLGVDASANYGTTEGFVAWQCPAGSYHINAEHMLGELLDEHDHPVPVGEMGRVVLTTLQNRVMPLVRYAIGDYAIGASGSC